MDGCHYDMSHLRNHDYHLIVGEISFKLLVRYSDHCISWGVKKGRVIDFKRLGEDKRIIGNKEERCFCPQRYSWSKNLPAIIGNIINHWCYETG